MCRNIFLKFLGLLGNTPLLTKIVHVANGYNLQKVDKLLGAQGLL